MAVRPFAAVAHAPNELTDAEVYAMIDSLVTWARPRETPDRRPESALPVILVLSFATNHTTEPLSDGIIAWG